MEPACIKMTLLVFIAVFVLRAKSQTEHSIGSYATGDTERCVCQPHVTINPPVCGRSVPVNSATGCNSTTIQELLRIVSTNQEDTERKVDELQVAVSGNQETVSFELQDTRRKMDELSTNPEMVISELRNTTDQLKDTARQVEELQVTVRGNQEIVSSEVQGLRRQLEELQVSVSALVELLRGVPTGVGPTVPKDCSEILARGVSRSGVYTVQPLDSGEAFQVYCDMETDGGGWTVFQRRKDGSVDFYLDFASYSRGFGNLEEEFWLGNDLLHRLTAQGEYELYIDLSDFENESRYAVYDSFSIADVSDNYRLTVGNYSGTAGDSLSYHNDHQFSTKDRDNDATSNRNCAQEFHGAWWYRYCHGTNLNGEYLRGTTTQRAQGVVWYHWKGWYYSLKTTEMKIRPTPQ